MLFVFILFYFLSIKKNPYFIFLFRKKNIFQFFLFNKKFIINHKKIKKINNLKINYFKQKTKKNKHHLNLALNMEEFIIIK